MLRELLRFDLPEELVATHPPEERDGGRLLILEPAREGLVHAHVRDLDEHLAPGALVVVNDTRVVPARLFGVKPSGGRVELLLVERLDARGSRWRAMHKASKPLRAGSEVNLEGGELRATIVAKDEETGLVELSLRALDEGDLDEALERSGHVPLPPYMRRPDAPEDRTRYQTVFARVPGAIAAPTAGLHLSNALIARLEAKGISIAAITLHVGLGTFQPVTANDLDDHAMHAELFEVPERTASAIAEARGRGAAVVAIGTTVVRALESAAQGASEGRVAAGSGSTRLLIQPGYRFRVVDQLLTNFHLPESTLLALVAAFAGRARVLEAYACAVRERYRFFSYGDAMLIQSRSLETT